MSSGEVTLFGGGAGNVSALEKLSSRSIVSERRQTGLRRIISKTKTNQMYKKNCGYEEEKVFLNIMMTLKNSRRTYLELVRQMAWSHNKEEGWGTDGKRRDAHHTTLLLPVLGPTSVEVWTQLWGFRYSLCLLFLNRNSNLETDKCASIKCMSVHQLPSSQPVYFQMSDKGLCGRRLLVAENDTLVSR